MKHIAIIIVLAIQLMACVASTPLTELKTYRLKNVEGLAEGLGGTGQKLAEGLGGTGQKLAEGLGGTGIVGTITGFGSIWVNTAHIHFDKWSIITRDQQASSEKSFKLGQVVAVLSDSINKDYQARSIDIVHEVIGPISSININNGQITVLKQTIKFTNKTLISLANKTLGNASKLKLNNVVKISGLRQANGHIVASRIDVIKSTNEVQLIGQYTNGLLSGQRLKINPILSFNSNDKRLLVKGILKDSTIYVTSIGTDSIVKVIEQASELLIESFLFDNVFDGDISVGGIDLIIPDGVEANLQTNIDDDLLIESELGNRGFFPTEDSIEILDNSFEEGFDFDSLEIEFDPDFFEFDPDFFIEDDF